MSNRTFRHRARAEGPLKGPTIFSVLVGLFVVFGSWPGWLNNDSVGMQVEALSGAFTDWHSPALTWFWSFLSPASDFVLAPYLIQQGLFWSGLTITVWVASQRIAWWAAMIPVIALLADHLWEIAWLSKDATALSLIVFSLGCFALSLYIKKLRYQIFWLLLSIFVTGSATIARWYLAPALLILIFAFLLAHRYFRWPALLVAALSFLGPLALERYVVEPSPSYHSASIQLLDIWRATCLGTKPQESTNADLFPVTLTVTNSDSICEGFNPYIWNELNNDWVGKQETRTTARLPRNNLEASELQSAWLKAWQSAPSNLIYARAMTGVQLLRIAEYWTALGPENKILSGDARLSLVRAPSALVSSGDVLTNILRNGALYVIGLPLILILVLTARGYRLRAWALIGLAFPLIWVINMAVVAPAIDTRYVAPAVGGSVLLFFIVLSFRSGISATKRPSA